MSADLHLLTNLVTLNAANAGLTGTLDLHGITTLTTVDANSNGLLDTTDVIGCTGLQIIDMSFTGLTSLILDQVNMTSIRLSFAPVVSFIAASLQTVSGDILLDGTISTTVTLTNLISIGNQLGMTSTSCGPTVSFPALQSIGSPITDFVDNPSLVTVSAPNLVTMSAGCQFNNCTSLTAADLNAYLPSILTNISFFNCALTTAYIDLILARCVASAGWGFGTETVDLSGGTNLSHASWSAGALADEATLVGRGATVLSNP